MQEETKARDFDLNIEKILEGWEVCHAIREIIANALDEQALTATNDVVITEDAVGAWHIRDWGRGLTYKHLTENENTEKLAEPGKVIGKFGVGLKDALATLHRRGVKVSICSKYGDFTLKETAKHGFEDVITLNASVYPPQDPEFVGTEFVLSGPSFGDVETAKGFFLRFSGEQALDETCYGQILQRQAGRSARIYVTGLLVAEEERFLFSYNITSLTAAMRKALNRERTNVGRSAYSERVKNMLLASQSEAVAQALADDLRRMQQGTNRDEVNWTDVAIHAGQVLNASRKVIFVSPSDLGATAGPPDHDEPCDGAINQSLEQEAIQDIVGHAIADGYEVVSVPQNIKQRLHGLTDVKGEQVRDIEAYKHEWSTSFEFKFVEENELTLAEREVFGLRGEIAKTVGGLPNGVREIKVSETMRPDYASTSDAAGLWEPDLGRIIVKRSKLRSLTAFAATLLHELTHARTGYNDLSHGFEEGLTETLGRVCAFALANQPREPLLETVPTVLGQPGLVQARLKVSFPGAGFEVRADRVYVIHIAWQGPPSPDQVRDYLRSLILRRELPNPEFEFEWKP